MKTAIIRSSWMPGYGMRLDCQPYLGGALETKVLLEKLSIRKDKLHSLTTGFDGGIYNGPQFVRNYVDSKDFGVPFLTGSTMQVADLSVLPLLSIRDAKGQKLRHLELQKGMSLISCSGSIGKMVYARPEMTGVWSSQDVLKVVADPTKVLSGYLYAYLSSKFGVPLLVSGTYGSMIQHLEPEQIAGLPVPRLGDHIEREIHGLIEDAAVRRDHANQLYHNAITEFEQTAGLPSIPPKAAEQFILVQSTELKGRLDTNFHRAYQYDALKPFLTGRVKGIPISTFARSIIEPVRFKRIEHDIKEFSIPFFGTGNLGDIDPEPLYNISRFAGIDEYRVDSKTLLIPRSGQIYGVLGTAFQPIGRVLEGAVTEDAIRINCESPEHSGYAFLALRSEWGKRQLKARAFGGSIPHLDVNNVGAVLIPKLTEKHERRLGQLALDIARLRSESIELENQARTLVENAVEASSRE